MHHLDLCSLVNGVTKEVLGNDGSLATAHQGLSIHFGSFLPGSLFPFVGGWVWSEPQQHLCGFLLPLQQCGCSKWQTHHIPAAGDTDSLLKGTESHLHPGTSGAWCCHKGWWLLHGAAPTRLVRAWAWWKSSSLRVPPLHPIPVKVISEQPLRSVLQVRRKEGGWQTRSAMLCHDWKVTAPPLSDTHMMQDIEKSCKQVSRSGNSVTTEIPERQVPP